MRDPTGAKPEDREQCIFAYLPHRRDWQMLISSMSCGLVPFDHAEVEKGSVSDSAELLHCYCQKGTQQCLCVHWQCHEGKKV